VPKRELRLWFHDVPVRTTGRDSSFDLAHVLSATATGDGAPNRAASEIRIRVLASRIESPRENELRVDERDDGFVVVRDENIEALVDLASLSIEARRRCANDDPRTFDARALATAFHLTLREQGTIALHAAVVLVEATRALLFVGDSGAGKTTTALAFYEAGCNAMTDDQVFLRRAADGFELLTAAQPFRVTDETLDAFRKAPVRARTASAAIKHELQVAAMVERFAGPIRLLFPRRIDQQQTRILPMSAAEALGHLMSASPLVAVGGPARARKHANLLRLLAQTSSPAWLELGRDLLESPVAAARRVLSLLGDSI
jgi:hypothetical protein